jgi:hypothetical protein
MSAPDEFRERAREIVESAWRVGGFGGQEYLRDAIATALTEQAAESYRQGHAAGEAHGRIEGAGRMRERIVNLAALQQTCSDASGANVCDRCKAKAFARETIRALPLDPGESGGV